MGMHVCQKSGIHFTVLAMLAMANLLTIPSPHRTSIHRHVTNELPPVLRILGHAGRKSDT